MILAAGRGERMRPLTDSVPKPMLKAGGKPLIQYHVENLVSAGVTDLVINHAHLGEQIESYLGDGSRFGAAIQYSPEQEALETGGGIFNVLPLLGDAPFIVINADVWCDYPLQNLVGRNPEKMHLVMVNNPTHNPDGDFNLSGESLVEAACGDAKRLTFSGVSVLNPALFIDSKPGVLPLLPLFKQAIAQGKASAEHYSGDWFDIGTQQRLDALEKYLAEK